MKLIRKKFLTLLLGLTILGVSVFVSMPLGIAQSGTNVSGIITSDTTWTQAGSPYTFTGNVMVNNAVTLTIQAGVTINLVNYYIMINGTLQAIGNNTHAITFNGGQITFTESSKDWNQTTKTGSIIEKSILTSAITIGNSIPINNNTIYGGITITKMSSDNIPTANPVISNNTFLGQGISANLFNVNPTISNNVISGCPIGISSLLDHNSSATIEGNLIINNTNGISLGAWFPWNSPIIQYNTITNNTNGITIGALGNTFYPKIYSNNIFNNTNHNIITELTYNTNATYNWWGTIDTQSISQTIYDYYHDFNLGAVTFTPFLSAPNSQAPTYVISSAGTGGSINPSGFIMVNYGDSRSFTITPDTGYYTLAITTNGTSVDAVSPYTVQNIQGATVISVTFAPNPTPTPTPTPTTTPTPTSTPSTTPTDTPTPTPTATPTSNPTANPTQQPTNPTTTPSPTATSTHNPTISPTPIPTVPESPSWTIPLLLTIMVAAGLLVYHKKPEKNKQIAKTLKTE